MNIPKHTIFFLFVFLMHHLACTPRIAKTTTLPAAVVREFLTDFTVNPNPNNFDTVGIVFSIDKKGKITPIANLNLNTMTDSVIVPKEIDSTNMTFGALANFLKIKGLDSAAYLGVSDSINVQASFRIDNGLQSRYNLDTNLPDAFQAKRSTIESNIKFMGLEKNKLFLIIETIRSPEVTISSIKSSNFKFDAGAVINNILKIRPQTDIYKQKDGGLSYKVGHSPVIFYKLRKINVSFVETKGDEKLIQASLGDEVKERSITN